MCFVGLLWQLNTIDNTLGTVLGMRLSVIGELDFSGTTEERRKGDDVWGEKGQAFLYPWLEEGWELAGIPDRNNESAKKMHEWRKGKHRKKEEDGGKDRQDPQKEKQAIPWAVIEGVFQSPFLLKLWFLGQHHFLTWEFVRNAESQAPFETFWIRIHILTRSPGDSYVH